MLELVILVGGIFVLGKSAHWLITAITHLSHYLHLSQFVTGFIILGIATSTPEIFIGLQSAWSGTPALSLGNLLGADIVLLTLVCGFTAIASRGVAIHQTFTRLMQIAALIAVPLVLLADKQLTQVDGIILVILYLGYLLYIFFTRPVEKTKPPVVHHHYGHTLLLAAAGLVGLIIASKIIVAMAVAIATKLQVAPLIIGTLVLSVGTNLPEITLVIESLRRQQSSLVIGDVLGSAATNTLVIALLAIISPFALSQMTSIYLTAGTLITALALFLLFSHSKRAISRKEGVALLGLYSVFLLLHLSLNLF